MDERFKSPPWKGGTGFTLSRVRISLSPPKVSFKQSSQVQLTSLSAGFLSIIYPIVFFPVLLHPMFFGGILDGILNTVKTTYRQNVKRY